MALVLLVPIVLLMPLLWGLGTTYGGGAMLGASALILAALGGWFGYIYYQVTTGAVGQEGGIAMMFPYIGAIAVIVALPLVYIALLLMKRLPRQKRG